MTCIVGIAQAGRVYLGADSMASNGYNRYVTALRKVFAVGPFLIGYCGSFRMGQILQYHLNVRAQQPGESDEQYMVVGFVEAVRTCFKDKGFTEIEKGVETGGKFLVGYRGHLYQVDPDFQVNRWISGIAAVGSGQEYALGALLALVDRSPQERIECALAIASELSNTVSPPFHVEILDCSPPT